MYTQHRTTYIYQRPFLCETPLQGIVVVASLQAYLIEGISHCKRMQGLSGLRGTRTYKIPWINKRENSLNRLAIRSALKVDIQQRTPENNRNKFLKFRNRNCKKRESLLSSKNMRSIPLLTTKKSVITLKVTEKGMTYKAFNYSVSPKVELSLFYYTLGWHLC